jgi:acyl carrier protein
MTIEERVREVAEQIVGLPEDVSKDTEISELGLDSLDVTEFIMELEEEFDITIQDDDVEKFVTFGDIIDYVENESK